MAAAMVHVRIDRKVRELAAQTLAETGMSVPDAVRMVRVAAEKALPFEARIPHATTVRGPEGGGSRQGQAFPES